ncbi:MAG TPA: FUSC family protein [Streptosporangiaceae bacterium]|nr:FUSC family protein [Streptosporangiaceae bacterium]
MPDWLVATARLQHAPVPWWDMARAALAIAVPLIAGILGGDRALGVLVATGGLLGVAVDVGGPVRARLTRVGWAAAGGAAGLAIGSLIHGRGWMAVIALVAVAGASALISSFGAVGSVAGLELLVYAAVSLGPLGALRPWWHTALGFLLGSLWALILIMVGWLICPRAAEQHCVAEVYRALARALQAIGTSGSAQARLAVTEALNEAYDSLFTARSVAPGMDRRLYRLVAEANQAHLISEAMTALTQEGTRVPPRVIDALNAYGDRIEYHTRPPAVPRLDGTTPGTLLLRDALAGLASMMSRDWKPTDALPHVPLRERLRETFDGPTVLRRLTGRLTRIYTIRLMVSIGVATVISEVLPLQRSYWVVLTVAIVLKPDFGSVFARALQRGAGTIIGAVLGAVILAVVPYGPWLLIPFGGLAALLPYGRVRNFGLQAVFLTPLVVLLIDLLAPGGWQLAEDRLIDTLIGCAVALVVGYAPWPTAWQAHLPDHFADAIWNVCAYLRQALVTAPASQDGMVDRPPDQGVTRLPSRSRLQRAAYRSLSDMRTEFQRTMSEPPPISRQATSWWPALAELEEVADAVTASTVSMCRGTPPPRPEAVTELMAALDTVADAVKTGIRPSEQASLPSDAALAPVTDAVRSVLGVIANPRRPPAARPATAAAP